jgi:hypothetical protein
MARTADFQDKNGNGTDDRDEGGNFVDTDKDGVDDNQDVNDSNPNTQFNDKNNNNKDIDEIKRGMSNFEELQDQFFSKADKEDTARSGLQLGLAADYLGKFGDTAFSKDMANFQSGMYKDNSKFGADLQYDFDAKTRADEFKYGMRSMDQQFGLQDEFQNRQFGRDIGMEQATGEQRRKDLKESGFQTRATDKSRIETEGTQQQYVDSNRILTTGDVDRKNYEFEDTINARGEERDRKRARGLARNF